MSYEFYKVLHFIGLFMAVAGLAGAIVHAVNGGTRDTNKFRKAIALTHGVGLAIAFVAGFGLLAKTQTPFASGWVITKFLIWLWLGLALAIVFRKPSMAGRAWWLMILLVLTAAFLAVNKPF